MPITFGPVRSTGLRLSVLCLALAIDGSASAGEADTIQQIVETFAQAAVQQGVTPGVGVGVVNKTRSYGWAFGYADPVSKTPFSTDSIFEIGSVTKVFTTNLFGQAVFEKRLRLGDSLSQFPRQLGTFVVPLTGQVTLEDLGDFTGGFPSYAPLCRVQIVPGCLPSGRPSISEYSAQDFLDYFRGATPTNFQPTCPAMVTSLPACYFYSDYSIGLLGLLLGTPPGRPVSNDSLNVWLKEVQSRILHPLGMTSTYLYVPASVPQTRIANGYSPALASAQVQAGKVTGITLLEKGAAYSSPPAVTITGGLGSGATAIAVLDDFGSVAAIQVKSGGSGYIAPPEATVTGGGNPMESATLLPIVADGQVKAVEVLSGGAAYNGPPTVTITGGLDPSNPKPTNATATAQNANGRVISILVTNGGAGYAPPLTVTVAPGNPESSGVPIWAPAGALLSTVDDLTRFAAAALGVQPRTGLPGLPAPLAAGFTLAETAYACAGKDPDLSTCPFGVELSGLAWAIHPADSTTKTPEVVGKNGGLPGFSTQVVLVPERQLAVVVLVNSGIPAADTGTMGNAYPLAAAPAAVLAFNIGYALLDALPN
jgi:CubicO group peptidase (beta-lactamase class C family)